MFKFIIALVLVTIIVSLTSTQAKIFQKCELAREMFSMGVPKSELPDWICLANGESSFNTKAKHHNSDNSVDWGIFQINDRYWCKPSDNRPSANACRIPCSDLLKDKINKAVSCARLIKKQQGWEAWVAWKNNCQHNKPSIKECF